jgi:hypothetical protein
MNSSTTNPQHNPLNANLKETYEIGKQLYWSGIHTYQAVHKAIRYLGFYLYMGDEERDVPSMKDDDEGRAKIIYDLLTKALFWSANKAKELWADIYKACKWRRGKAEPEKIPELSTDSVNSFNRKNSSTITICNPEQASQEQKPASKEEIRAIFKSVLGSKVDIDNPRGLFATMLKPLPI